MPTRTCGGLDASPNRASAPTGANGPALKSTAGAAVSQQARVDALISKAFVGVRGTKYTYRGVGKERSTEQIVAVYQHKDNRTVRWRPDARTEQKIADLLAQGKTEEARKLVRTCVTNTNHDDKSGRKRPLLSDAAEQFAQAAALGHTAAPFEQRAMAKMQQSEALQLQAMALQRAAMDDHKQATALRGNQDRRLQEGRDTLEEAVEQSAEASNPPAVRRPTPPAAPAQKEKTAGNAQQQQLMRQSAGGMPPQPPPAPAARPAAADGDAAAARASTPAAAPAVVAKKPNADEIVIESKILDRPTCKARGLVLCGADTSGGKTVFKYRKQADGKATAVRGDDECDAAVSIVSGIKRKYRPMSADGEYAKLGAECAKEAKEARRRQRAATHKVVVIAPKANNPSVVSSSTPAAPAQKEKTGGNAQQQQHADGKAKAPKGEAAAVLARYSQPKPASVRRGMEKARLKAAPASTPKRTAAKKPKPSPNRCPTCSHTLKKTKPSRSKGVQMGDNMRCDGRLPEGGRCRKPFGAGDTMWSCERCDFDLCKACAFRSEQQLMRQSAGGMPLQPPPAPAARPAADDDAAAARASTPAAAPAAAKAPSAAAQPPASGAMDTPTALHMLGLSALPLSFQDITAAYARQRRQKGVNTAMLVVALRAMHTQYGLTPKEKKRERQLDQGKPSKKICKALTAKRTPCSCRAKPGSDFCGHHGSV